MFAVMVAMIVIVGYPLHLLAQRMLGWQMSFMDSPIPAIPLYLCMGLWLDAVLTLGAQPLARKLSPILIVVILVFAFLLEHSAYGMLLFLPGIAFIGWVLLPAAKSIHFIEGRKAPTLLLVLDTLLVAAFLPLGVWILQLRLNAAIRTPLKK